MALTDLLASDPPPERPPGITCDHYAPGEGARCGDYLPNGACARPDEFMCREWMKHNAHRPAVPAAAEAPPADRPPALRAGALLTREDVETFKRLGVEVEFSGPLGTFWLVPARTGQPRLEFLPEELVTVVNVIHVFGGQIVALTRGSRPLPDASLAVASAEADAPTRSAPEGVDAHAARDAREHLRQLRESVAGPAQGSLFAPRGEAAR